ncbi:hypothetical protein QBC47DRAFT_407403 [Echria macrotheca]|uniref:PLD phosphodiesterase domain-containing protein n=1 Tax=Echria macrotheca TaxID=438768 RepID=A0AAJ0B4S4_9PEZI|nr:hypothetical protein QBC47DRAFT_407403 [Echria macrotheca]
MVKLQELEQALRKLHPTEGKQGPAFSLTSNNTLLGSAPSPFDAFMLIPFQRWDNRLPPPENETDAPRNVIAESFKEVLEASLPAGGTPIEKNKIFLIDLALLDEPQDEFMRRSHMTEYLAATLKNDALKNAKVVIRFLVGSHFQDQLRDKFLDNTGQPHDDRLAEFKKIFWPGGKNALEHPDVTLLIGYYNPSLILAEERKPGGALDWLDYFLKPLNGNLTKKPKSVKLPHPALATGAPPAAPKETETDNSWGAWLTKAFTNAWNTTTKAASAVFSFVWAVAAPLFLERIKNGSPDFYPLIQKFIQEYPQFEETYRKESLPAMSWNHAKYAAVNGKAMMTGGFNYWNDYVRQGETADNVLLDFGIKMKGDAALSVHAFADDIWDYLKTMNPDMDKRSMAWKVNPAAAMADAKFVAASKDDIPTGLFKQTAIQPTAAAGQFRVLTTARVGSMQLDDYRYPSQLLDAFRDMALNVSWHRYEAVRKIGDPADHGNAIAEMVQAAENLLEGTNALPPVVGTTAAAWASKYARLYAIENAQKCIHMTAQSLVDRLEVDKWKGNNEDKTQNTGVVDNLNKSMGFTDEQAWNGDIWPYDLLVAFSKALSRLAKLPAPTAAEQSAAQGAAIYVILSCKDGAYGDPATLDELKKRLKATFRFMAHRSGDYLLVKTAEADVDDIVDKRFLVKRVLGGNAGQKLHAKTVSVDREVVYVGSDNAYPHYNEEFGCWVEDKGIVDAYFTGFYDELWKQSSVKTGSET